MKTEIPEAAIRAGAEALKHQAHLIERYIGDDEECLELVQAVLTAAAPHMHEWRPIETAPMSEEMKLPNYVLVSNQDNGYVFVGYRHEPNYPGDPEWCDEHGEFICPQPTHWQPRPEPPRKEVTDENH